MQHIRIKYSVDKSEVDKSNASVQQAKALTDNLTKSTQNLGTQGAKSFKQYQAPIEEAKIKMQQLRAQIDLTARSDTKRLNDLIAQYKVAKKQVDDFNKSLHAQANATKQTTGANQNLLQSFTGLYNAIKLIVAAGLVRELVDATLEAAKLSGNVQAVGNAFAKQIPNAELLLRDLQKATRGTVGELELMQRALKFQNFGADVSRLPELLEFAAVRAQQTGESVDYLVNSIVNGIGRKSILILDNLGISATRLKAEFNGASLQAQSVGEVTAAVGKIAKEELEKMGGFAENAATKVSQIEVAWERAKVAFAKRIENTAILDFFKSVSSGAEKALDPRSLRQQGVDAASQRELIKIQEKVNKERERGIEIVEQELASIDQRISDGEKEVESWKDRLSTLKLNSTANKKLLGEGQQAIQYYVLQREELVALKIALEDYAKGVKAAADANKDVLAAPGLIPALQDEIDALEELINGTEGKTGRTGGAKTRGELVKLNRELEILKARMADLQRLGTGLIWDKDLKAWIDIEKIWKNIKKIDTKTVRDASDDFAKLADQTHEADKRIRDLAANPLPTTGGSNTTRAEVMAKQVREAFALAEEELTMGGIDIANNLGNAILDIELMNQEARLNNIRDFYDEQQNLAGNNSRYQAELRVKEDRETKKAQRELAISQRRARLYSIAIDTAASIAKAWVNPGWPGAIPLSAFLLAQGATQAAIVSRQPMGFKEGVIDLKGPGTTTSDSIPANLSRRESVMTANETMSSKGILMAIRSKTLDDAKLARIVGMNRGPVGKDVDTSRLEKHLVDISKNTSGSNWMNNTGALIEAKREGNTTKRYNRSKFMYS